MDVDELLVKYESQSLDDNQEQASYLCYNDYDD